MVDKNYALRICLSYVVFGIIWISLSDTLAGMFFSSKDDLTFISILKGWLFVILTTILIYFMSHRYLRKLSETNENLLTSCEQLSIAKFELKQKLENLEKKEATIRAIFNATTDAIVIHDSATAEIINCNQHAEQLFGLTLSEAKQLGIEKIIRRSDHNLIDFVKSTPPQGARLIEQSIITLQGKSLHLEIKHSRAVIDGRECILAVIRDITERKKAALELARAQNQKIAILKAIPDLILLFNQEGVFLDYSPPTYFDMFLPPEKFLGKNIVDVFPSDFAQKALYLIHQAIATTEIQLFEYELCIHNQLRFYEARFVKNGDSEALTMIRDITSKKQMEQQLEHLSLHDALTELYNRGYLEDQILKIRSHGNSSSGFIICDVDGLKLINDTLGHHAGDDLLKIVAKILQACTAPPDVVARVGGDEFAILVFEPTDQKMTNLANEIRAAVASYNQENQQLPLSLSIGWATNTDGQDIELLMKEADNNMYREKVHHSQSTRNSVVQALMQALEARDYITEGHGDRLQSLVENLALKLNLPNPKIADLRLLAQFHDIGKVGIPDNILFKPDRLTPDEFAVMRTHAEIGFRIAKSAPILFPIAEWILKHHEAWNGQGYPLGLAGEDIPLECRILAIADAYDAMTNDRPYRKALTTQEAIAELKRCSGSQFDPALVNLFIKMENPSHG